MYLFANKYQQNDYSYWSLGRHAYAGCTQYSPTKTKNPRTYKKSKNNSKNNSQNKPQKQPQNINGVGDKNQGTSNDKITNVNSGKLTQTLILTFLKKSVKRKGATQLAPQWTKKLNTRIVFKPMSRRAKATNIKMVKDIITDILENMFPTKISPILAHLVSYKNLGKVSKKVQKQTKRLKKKEKNRVSHAEYAK